MTRTALGTMGWCGTARDRVVVLHPKGLLTLTNLLQHSRTLCILLLFVSRSCAPSRIATRPVSART
jgi:hypothetical protein